MRDDVHVAWSYTQFDRFDGRGGRLRILDVAERLMTDQGYNATSLDQVIAESSSSKGAFFHHFRSKSDLALRLVERYLGTDLAHLDEGLAAVADIDDPAARVVAFLRFFEDWTQKEIGEDIGVSQMQVSRTLTRLLATLREELGTEAATLLGHSA